MLPNELIRLCTHHYSVRMRKDSPFRPGEFAEIIGFRPDPNAIGKFCYTIRFSDFSTAEIPSNAIELLKYCDGMPYQRFLEEED